MLSQVHPTHNEDRLSDKGYEYGSRKWCVRFRQVPICCNRQNALMYRPATRLSSHIVPPRLVKPTASQVDNSSSRNVAALPVASITTTVAVSAAFLEGGQSKTVGVVSARGHRLFANVSPTREQATGSIQNALLRHRPATVAVFGLCRAAAITGVCRVPFVSLGNDTCVLIRDR
jgi:hypothetical protein